MINCFSFKVRSFISSRESRKGEYYDFIELMINARHTINVNDEQDIDDSEQLFRQSDDKQIIEQNIKLKAEVSDEDIVALSMEFFVAGFENTSATLSYMFYALATNEKCQQKLCEESKSYGPNFTYEDITRMPYLEACVAETLRLYNTIAATSRVSAHPYKIGLLSIIFLINSLV